MNIDKKTSTDVKAVKGIIEHEGTYLLAKHNIKFPDLRGKWTFLGGWVEPSDASYEETLKRELEEELQLKIKIQKHIGLFRYKNRTYLVLAAKAGGTPKIISDEILEINWFNYNQIVEMDLNKLLQTGFEIPALQQYLKVQER